MNLETAYTYGDVNIIPQASDIDSRKECNTTVSFLGTEVGLPIVPANMSTVVGPDMLRAMHKFGSIGIMHRFNGWYSELEAFLDEDFVDFPYAASIGVNKVNETFYDIMNLSVLPKFIVIDVAHGHHVKTEAAIKTIKEMYNKMPVVAGNVATGTGAVFLAGCGADAIKVGVGNGSLCETRIRTGIGIPQFSAVASVRDALDKADFKDVQIIADGGVETPGDVAKAIGVGADLVMSGNFFSGTEETPLPLLKSGNWANPTRYKQYAGSASHLIKTENGNVPKNIEGNAKLVQYKGSCETIMTEIRQGLQSSMSYVGARTIEEFRERCYFVQVTPNGTREAFPYLLG